MEYTISDIGTLRMYMYLWTFFITLFFLAIIVFSVIKIPFDLKLGKQTDVFVRRIIFFIGLFVTMAVVFFMQLRFIVNFKVMIIEEDMTVVAQALAQTIPATVATSGVIFLILFTVLAMTFQQWIGYKPYSVLKSNNKWFGLF